MICKEVDTMYNLSRKNVAVADDSTNFTWDCSCHSSACVAHIF